MNITTHGADGRAGLHDATRGEPRALVLLGHIVGAITGVAIAVAAAGVLVSLGLITYGVVMRYAFNSPPVWVDDLVGFALVGIVMLAAPVTLRKGEHISVDILTDRLGSKGKRWAEGWATASVAVVSAMLAINGWETAMSSRMLGIITSGWIELPIWLLQLLLPTGGCAMFIVAVEALLRLLVGALSLATAAHLGEEVE